MLRFIFTVLLLIFGAYFALVKDFGGRSLAGHVMEVFDSDVVQKKIAGLKSDMREDLEVRLAKAQADRLEKSGKEGGKKPAGYDIINDADRESLSQLIEKKTAPKK